MFDISAPAAFIAGLLSFLSPCVLPLVPPYLVYLTGETLDEMAENQRTTPAVLLALLFVAGFSTVFIALGASASVFGSLIRAYANGLSVLAGVVIIVMGLHFLGLFRLPMLMGTAKLDVLPKAGPWGAYVMGLAFAFGWTPCIGPVLAGILAVAASEDTVYRGAGLLAVYSAGLGIPFVVAAFAVKPFMMFMQRFRSQMRKVEMAMGALLVLTGIGFLTGQMATFAFLLLEWFRF